MDVYNFMFTLQLFYLITSFNVEDGNLKEMKRWGYEIHSTFTAPGAVSVHFIEKEVYLFGC